MSRQIINPWSWQDQAGFVQGHAVDGGGRTLYCAGQTSVDADGNPIHEGDMTAQILQSMGNVEAVLRGGGASLADVVRLTYYTTDVDAFLAAQEALVPRLHEAGCRATATLLGVSQLAFPPLLVEIEATAVVDRDRS